jgi:hypothetical protein
MIFNREWAMPSQWTFTIAPIKQLIHRYCPDGKRWIDPFSGTSSVAEITNDINIDRPAKYHMEASEFIKYLPDKYNGILFDPPYSPRQIKEMYESADIKNSFENTQSTFWSNVKDLAASKIIQGGVAICFGWNTNGFGKNRGFEMVEILLVAHGGAHNDTIVTVERKFSPQMF